MCGATEGGDRRWHEMDGCSPSARAHIVFYALLKENKTVLQAAQFIFRLTEQFSSLADEAEIARAHARVIHSSLQFVYDNSNALQEALAKCRVYHAAEFMFERLKTFSFETLNQQPGIRQFVEF